MLTAVGAVTGVVVMGKLTATASAGTVTLAGTVAAGESEASVTTAPPAGAASLRRIVPVAEPPPTRLPALTPTPERDGPGSPGVSVSVAPCVVPSVPEIVTVVFADTALVVTGNDALLAPAITRRLIEDFCRRPAPGALPDKAAALSERELEVLQLLARGLSNAEIASRLYLSDATVKSHVARILAKLDLRDRIQTVVYAYESGLVRPGEPDA